MDDEKDRRVLVRLERPKGPLTEEEIERIADSLFEALKAEYERK